MARSDPQSSIPRSAFLPRNVVVAGETGVGKSSFINLVAGGTVTATNNDVRGVTARPKCHHWEAPDHTYVFRLWDTPGLNEGPGGSVSSKKAKEELRNLLKQLSREDGVHLLILCMRGTPVTEGMRQNYDVILRIRDQVSPKIPLAAVITDLEKRCDRNNIASSMERWWSDNKEALRDRQMTFCGHACLTTIGDKEHPPMDGRYAASQHLARDLIIDHALPHDALTHNTVVVGQTGVGKSSIINLVTGSESAIAANSARAVTTSTSYHDWVLKAQTFRFWDTPGFGQGPDGSPPAEHAYNAVQSLLTELGRGAGVHLLMLCFRGKRITKGMKETYDILMALRNNLCPNTPLVAVVTGLEPTPETNRSDVLDAMEQWWHANSTSLTEQGMTFSGHACITTLPDDAHPQMLGRRDECQRYVRNLVIDRALTPHSVPAPDLHVVLFGETGVGKSSLVNLLAGWGMAPVSDNANACTFQSTEYQFQLGRTTVRLWDTVGLEEAGDKKTVSGGYTGAIERAVELVGRLSASGGINLFLFCIRGNRVTKTMQSNYRLFYEVLGKKQVPIALAVTHLERESAKMEDWWERNVDMLEKDGIRVCGHACITTLAEHPKCFESRSAVQELLWQYADQGKFVMPSEAWLGRLLSGLRSLLGFGMPKDLVHVLTKRCLLEPDVAQEVATCIENTTGT